MEKKYLERLLEVPETEWMRITSILLTHLKIKLYNKTLFGAHSKQRLKMDPFTFYIDNSIIALYEGEWVWNYEQFSLLEQLKRIIDSKCSAEVEKYKRERHKPKKTFLVPNPTLFSDLPDEDVHDEESDEYLKKFEDALNGACQGNEIYTKFIELKRKGLNYDEICTKMECTKSAAYRMMEAIGRRANVILNSK